MIRWFSFMTPLASIFDRLPWPLRGFREGVELAWSHSWPWPHWVAVAVTGGVLAAIIGLTLREPIGSLRLRWAIGLLRAALACVLVWMMYGWFVRPYRTESPELVIVLDQSSSMARVDESTSLSARRRKTEAANGSGAVLTASRWQAALRVLREGQFPLLRRLANRYQIRCFTAGASVNELPTELADLERRLDAAAPTQEESRLGRALQEILNLQRSRPTAAIVFFTDGANTDGPTIVEAIRLAVPPLIPVYVVGLGSEQAPRDVWLADVLVESSAFVDDWLVFDANVRQRGYSGKPATLRLRQLDNNRIVAETPFTLPEDDQTQTVQLAFRTSVPGEHRFRIELEPFPDEAQRDNNQLERTIAVRDESIRVLLVQAYPNHEFHFLKRFLGRSLERAEEAPVSTGQPMPGELRRRTFRLSTVLQESDPEYSTQDETALRLFPVQREELFSYDVVIFGDVNPSGMAPSSLQNLADFVTERGGGLVVLAGPRYTPQRYAQTPLERLLPVRLETVTLPTSSPLTETFRVRPSAFGRQAPPLRLAGQPSDNARIWEGLPGLYWAVQAHELRPAARSWLEAVGRTSSLEEPLSIVSTQFVGAGKVVFHSTDETYRWSRSAAGEQYYERYWLQTLRYLSRAKLRDSARELELTTDRREYRPGDAVLVRARFLDERLAPDDETPLEAILERGSGQRRSLLLQRKAQHRGVFETQLADLSPGRYQVWLSRHGDSASATSPRFEIVSPQVEQERLTMDGDELRKAASLSRGRFYTLAEIARLESELPRGERIRTVPLPPKPVWNSSWVAGAVVTLMSLIWFLRKRAGLP